MMKQFLEVKLGGLILYSYCGTQHVGIKINDFCIRRLSDGYIYPMPNLFEMVLSCDILLDMVSI